MPAAVRTVGSVPVTGLHLAMILAAGFGAGFVNAMVGAGTLITFPTLVALGYPPIVANVSNTVGLVPGSVAGSWGYRRELVGQGPRLRRLSAASIAGGVTGAGLLLVAPERAFEAVVPVLLLAASGLVVVQPWLRARVELRALQRGEVAGHEHGRALLVGAYLAGVYGGYFGAAQGVVLIALLGTLLDETMLRVNAAKNVLTGLVNAVSGAIFVVLADVDWAVAGTIAVASIAGATAGARAGRRLPAPALRAFVACVGITATTVFVLNR